MKKVFAFLLAVLFACSLCAACAEGTDFAAMSDDELHALVDGARNELAKREFTAAEDTVLLEQDGVTVYLTGERDVNSLGDYVFLKLEAVVVNDSDKSVAVAVDSASANGWDVYSSGLSETSPGKKQKGSFDFNLADADISSFEELEELEVVLRTYDGDSYQTLFETEPIVLHFNAE